jgi:hypothetical protein
MRLLIVAMIVATLASACSQHRGPIPAGLAAVDPTNLDGAATPERFTSPSGRVVERDEVDDQGWVLPLDIRRPRPSRKPPTTAPALAPTSLGPGLGMQSRLGPDDGHSENEPSIAAVPGTVIVGWNQFTNTTALQGVSRSIDGGSTWTSTTLAGHDAMSDPMVAAGVGVWYFGYIARGGATGTDFDVFVRRSLDDGASWQPPVPVTVNATFDDKPYLAARGNEVLVAYADFSFSPAKVRATRSLDSGQTFGSTVVLANTSVGGNGASPVIAPDGTYYVFWRDSFQESLWMSKSTDQGSSWSTDTAIADMDPLPSTLPGGFRMVNLPVAAICPLDGSIVVLWNDEAFGDADILAVRSEDAGATWSLPTRVNDDTSGQAQFLPWITFDPTGTGWALWYDRRHDGAAIDVYLARTDDCGVSWQPNQRVTAAGFTPVLPTEPGAAAFIGDYNGIAAADGKVFLAFQDSRRGEQDVWVSVVEPGPFADGFESGDTSAWSSAVGD